MQEYKPFKEGKVREVYDNGDSLIWLQLTEYQPSITFLKIR